MNWKKKLANQIHSRNVGEEHEALFGNQDGQRSDYQRSISFFSGKIPPIGEIIGLRKRRKQFFISLFEPIVVE